MHKSSLDKMQWFKDTHLTPYANRHARVLDVGSYDVNGTYKDILNDPAWTYVGADLAAGPNVDVVLQSPYKWGELKSSSFDIVVSGQAFEHIEWFWLTMLEIERVLKPGGICCILAPASGYEHKYPVDCWRFYPDGFTAVAKFAKMETLHAAMQWEPLGYEDGSDEWKDSILVARKPAAIGTKDKITTAVRNSLLAFALRL
jgi:SAM-dependent methyltransferase